LIVAVRLQQIKLLEPHGSLMKQCSYCGRDNAADASYCYKCGTEFKRPDEPSGVASSEEPLRPEFEFASLSEADRQKDLITLVSCRT